MTKVWVPVAEAKDDYEVSSDGDVRSLDRTIHKINRWGQVKPLRLRGRILKPYSAPNGYLTVRICSNEVRWAVHVHRLVAIAFCTPVPGKEHVNHRDGNKKNNASRNLEWCTRSENMLHANDSGLCGVARAVIAIPKRGGEPLQFVSSKAAAEALGKPQWRTNIRSALCGLIPSAYGYLWSYQKPP